MSRVKNWHKVILLTLCLSFVTCGCQSYVEPIKSSDFTPAYFESNWKVCEQSLFDNNTIWVDMPSNMAVKREGFEQYDCFYNDKESRIYVFPLSSFVYSQGAVDSSEAVYVADDAIDKAKWAIELYLGKQLEKTVKLIVTSIEEKEVNAVKYSTINMNIAFDGIEEKYYGVWVNHDGRVATLWFSTDKELLNMIFGTIRQYTS